MTTVVAALAAGSLGALLTTFLRIRHERAELFKTRMASVADELATALHVAEQHVVRAGTEFFFRGRRNLDRDGIQRYIDDANHLLARVDLLFGPRSPAADAGGNAVSHLHAALAELRPDLTREQAKELDEAWEDRIDSAGAHYYAFVAAARAAIHGGRRLSLSVGRYRITLFDTRRA